MKKQWNTPTLEELKLKHTYNVSLFSDDSDSGNDSDSDSDSGNDS